METLQKIFNWRGDDFPKLLCDSENSEMQNGQKVVCPAYGFWLVKGQMGKNDNRKYVYTNKTSHL